MNRCVALAVERVDPFPRPGEDRVPHRAGEPAGVGVLAARVERAEDQRPVRAEGADFHPVAEFGARPVATSSSSYESFCDF